MIKKIGKYFLFGLLGLFFALLLLPFVFKSKIVEGIKNAVNDAVIAEVSFNDLDVSFIRSFPDLSLKIKDVLVVGKDTFEGTTLLKAGTFSVDVDVISLLFDKKTPSIEYIGIEKGLVNVLVLPDGTANYNIMPEDTTAKTEEATTFKLDIQKYEISQTDIVYTDQSMPLFVSMSGVNHTGKGNFAASSFDLDTKTQVDTMTVRYDGDVFVNKAKASLDAVFAVDLDKQKFGLKDNRLLLNELDLSADGFVQLNGDDIMLEFKASTPLEDIRQLLSVVPHAYTKDFSSVKTSGKASFSLTTAGIYNGIKQLYPAFDLAVKVDNGYILYPGSPFPVQKLFIDMKTGAKKSDLSDLYVSIPAFRFLLNKDQVDGQLNVNNALGNQAFTGKLHGKLNLGHIKSALPLSSFEKLDGLLDINLQFAALMNHILEENYEKIEAKGHAVAQNLHVKTSDYPTIKATKIEGDFNPRLLDFNFSDLAVGSSHLFADVNVSNPLAFFTMDKASSTNIKFTADKINLDEWSTSNKVTTAEPAPEFAFDKKQEAFIKESDIKIDGRIGELRNGQYLLRDIDMSGEASANLLKINRLYAKIGDSDMTVTGVVKQAFDYLFGNSTLLGKVTLTSDYFDSNMFAGASSPSEPAASTGPFIIPDKMDIEVDGRFKKIKYTNHTLENLNGKIHLMNQQVVFEDIITNAFGGKIGFTGSYGTADPKRPEYAMKLNLGNMRFTEAFRQIDMFKKLVPIAEYIQGYFNTDLVMKGRLTEDMSPDLSTLDASGFIETLQGKIKAYPPLLEVGNTLKIKELQDVDLTNTKNWFDIVQGIIDVKPFKKSVKGIDMDVSGKHSFTSGMDFNIKMKIPRALLEKNQVTASANAGLSMLEKEASKLGLNIKQGDYINLNVNLSGKLRKPAIKITPLASDGEGNYQDAMKNKIDDTGKKLKDTIQKEIKKTKEKVRDTLTKAAQQQLEKGKEKAQKEMDKAVEVAKEKAKKEVISKIDTLLPDTLKNKARDVIDKNTNEEINKIKDKLKDFDPFKKKKKN